VDKEWTRNYKPITAPELEEIVKSTTVTGAFPQLTVTEKPKKQPPSTPRASRSREEEVASPTQYEARNPKKYLKSITDFDLVHESCHIHTPQGVVTYITADDFNFLYKIHEMAMLTLLPTIDGGVKKRDVFLSKDGFAGLIANAGLNQYFDFHGNKGTNLTRFNVNPDFNLASFSKPFVAMYNVEKLVYNAIKHIVPNRQPDQRLIEFKKSVDTKILPEDVTCFPGIPVSTFPATQVGISSGFYVDVHADSSETNLTETIFWANENLNETYFVLEEYGIKFDVGTRPCMVLCPPSIRHGTAPGDERSVGLVIITKRSILSQPKNTVSPSILETLRAEEVLTRRD
jgi:hypothetical protein